MCILNRIKSSGNTEYCRGLRHNHDDTNGSTEYLALQQFLTMLAESSLHYDYNANWGETGTPAIKLH